MMKTSEGKLGRVFFVRLENDEDATAIQQFAVENGIAAAQIFVLGAGVATGIIAPDANGTPGLWLADDVSLLKGTGDVVIQELLGFTFQRVTDPVSGQEVLARVTSSKTRVMERPAPVPDEGGPGTVPVFLFNAEFN